MRLFFWIFLTTIAFYSCKNSENKQTGTVVNNDALAKSSLNDTGTQNILAVIHNYYELKDALVLSDAAKADEAAEKLRTSTRQLETFLSNDSANTIQLNPESDSLVWGIDKILSVKDETTEYKRISFETVSNAVYHIIIKTGLTNAGIYRQYCPMAFNDKGAYWLSNEMEIRNPYFGTKMLECGEVTDTL
jgi:hypothetical protein